MNESGSVEDRPAEFEMRGSGRSVIGGCAALAAILAVVLGMKYWEYYKNGASPAWILSDLVQVPPFVRGELGVLAALAGAFWGWLRSRRIRICGDRLRSSSWFSDDSWPIADLTEAVLEVVRTRNGETSVVVLRRGGGEEALWLGTPAWSREDVRRLLDAVRRRNPSLRVSDDVRLYLSGTESPSAPPPP